MPQEIPEEKGESSELILGGTDDNGHEAVAIVRAVTSPTTVSLCTGTLIRSNIMLTAGHCAFNGSTQLHDVDVSFSARPNIAAPLGDSHWVAGKIFPNPAYTGVGGSGEDVSVIVLAQDVAITPMKLAKAPAVGSTVTGRGLRLERARRRVVRRHDQAPGRHPRDEGRRVPSPRAATTSARATATRAVRSFRTSASSALFYGDTRDCKRTSYSTRADDVADFIQSIVAAADGSDDGDDLPATWASSESAGGHVVQHLDLVHQRRLHVRLGPERRSGPAKEGSAPRIRARRCARRAVSDYGFACARLHETRSLSLSLSRSSSGIVSICVGSSLAGARTVRMRSQATTQR